MPCAPERLRSDRAALGRDRLVLHRRGDPPLLVGRPRVLVLVGVPFLVLVLGVVIKPLQRRQREQREQVGQLTALGADTAIGLRILRGIGGEPAFLARYRVQSEKVRLAGVKVAVPQSTLDAAQVFLPGLFVVLVTWLGARFVVSGPARAGRARRVLRVRGLSRDPAPDGSGSARQDHPCARRCPTHARRPRHRAQRRRAGDSGLRPGSPGPFSPTGAQA